MVKLQHKSSSSIDYYIYIKQSVCRLMKTSPAAVETPDQVSPREAWTEGETIPLDQVMNVLYSNIEEMKKIETLTFAQEVNCIIILYILRFFL